MTNKNYLCKGVMADGAGHPPTSAVRHHCPGPTPARPWGFPERRGCRGDGRAQRRLQHPSAQPRDWAAAAPRHGWAQGRGKGATVPQAELDPLADPGLVMNQPLAAPWRPSTAAPVPVVGRTKAAAPQPQAERRKRSSSRAEHPSRQPPCSDFARPQPSPRSWLSLGQHQFLPASHSSPSLQCSEPGSELPPGRNRRQRRKTGTAPSSMGLPAQSLQPPVLCPPSSWGSPPETPNLPPGPESHEDTGRGTLLPGFIGRGGRALQSHQ